MAGNKTSTNMFKELSYEMKKTLFITAFSSGRMSTGKFEDKIELIKLLCYLTYEASQREPFTYQSSLQVLEKILNTKINKEVESNGFDAYLVGLSILCDDLIYGCDGVPQPENCTGGNDAGKKIKSLIDQWQAF